jgi:GNAT superfamily N-acetyltransferase
MGLNFLRLNGEEARPFVNELATLRLKVFWDFPYLYVGSLDYEKKYLETYFKAKNSFIFVVKDGDHFVGVTTGIWAFEEEDSFKIPFEEYGINPREVFYFGESILLPEYRGRGLGKIFFEERESFAKSLEFIEYLAFCAVERDEDHPLRPAEYRKLDSFWESQGFKKEKGLVTFYEWNDRCEEQPSAKKMQYWLKNL